MELKHTINGTKLDLLDPFTIDIYVRHGDINQDEVLRLYLYTMQEFNRIRFGPNGKHKLHDEFVKAYYEFIDYVKLNSENAPLKEHANRRIYS